MSPQTNRPTPTMAPAPSPPTTAPVPFQTTPAVLSNPVDCTACGSQADDHKSPCACHCHFDVVGHAFIPDATGHFPDQCNQAIAASDLADACICGYPPGKHR